MATTSTRAAVSGADNAGIASERERIISILESIEGKRNPAMAQKLALYSALDSETARSILADAPAANPYLAAMQIHGPVGINSAPVNISGDAKAERLEEIKANVAAFNASNRRAQGLPPKD